MMKMIFFSINERHGEVFVKGVEGNCYAILNSSNFPIEAYNNEYEQDRGSWSDAVSSCALVSIRRLECVCVCVFARARVRAWRSHTHSHTHTHT